VGREGDPNDIFESRNDIVPVLAKHVTKKKQREAKPEKGREVGRRTRLARRTCLPRRTLRSGRYKVKQPGGR